jgi:acetolactate synthase-1/2/3 large subunit
MDEKTSTADTIASTLKTAGVEYVFGHPGGEVVDLIEALANENIQFILTGHESAASFMAGAVGRLTGRPGVCLATLGPGASNLLLGVACGLLDRDPLLAFSARTANSRAQISGKQNLRLNEMYAPITKWSVALNGWGTARTIQSAITVASTPPLGPVYLSLPADVAISEERADENGAEPPIIAEPDPSNFKQIEKSLNAARRPVGVIGMALNPTGDIEAVRKFFTETGIPYVVTPRAKGFADENGPNFLGAVAPAVGDRPHLTDLLRSSDCLLGAGFDPVESSYSWHYEAPVYSIASGPTGFEKYQPTAECTGNVAGLFDELRIGYRGKTRWTQAEFDSIKRRVQKTIIPKTLQTEAGLAPYAVVRTLQEALPTNTILTADVGAHKVLLAQTWQTSEPNGVLLSNGLSAMGYGLPAAIVASMLNPHRPVVGVLGDGGFAMMVQELETALRIGVQPLLIVFCDRSLAIIKMAQDKRHIPHRGVDFRPVDWAHVADGFGAHGVTISSGAELERAVSKWIATPQLTVLAVEVDESLYAGLTY